jgi:hypothetical protein
MKRAMPIGCIAALLTIVAFLFWQHFKPSDEKLHREITGSWTRGGSTLTFDSDGSFQAGTYRGTWDVKDGYLISVLTNTSTQNPARVSIDRFKILHVDERQLVYGDARLTNSLERN